MSNTISRPAMRQQIPQWLRQAYRAVRDAVTTPQIRSQSGSKGMDTYASVGGRNLTAPRGLNSLCKAGRDSRGSKVLTAISNEYYMQLCDEIKNYSDNPEPAARPAPARPAV